MHRLALAWLLLVACGTASPPAPAASPAPSTSSPTPSTTTSPQQPNTLAVAGSRYGKIIVDGRGGTVYLFDAEHGTTPKCYGPCAVAWPPLVTTTALVAGGGLSQTLIATTARGDGSMQVTYNGHALYRYAGDHAPGEIKCQAVVEYGGGWFVVDAQGNEVTAP